jgi:hypothetical protein
MSMSLQIKGFDVHSETIAGETVIVHLATGNYYSLRGVGTAIWKLIETGAGEERIAQYLAEHYGRSAEELKKDVGDFIARLRMEELIEDGQAGQDAAGLALDAQSLESAYAPPTIETYSDMQELLLIDPVHEVDDTGWPNKGSDAN